MPGFGRLPNRYGTITRLSGKRRKPYCARKFIGEIWDDATGKYSYKYVSVGTYATRKEALAALSRANTDENFSRDSITFAAVAEKWLEEKKPEISAGLLRNYRYALDKLTPLHRKKLRDLKTDDYERVINSDGVPRSARAKCKVLLNGVYNYALRHEYVQKDYSALVKVYTDYEPKIERKVFTPEEVRELENKVRSVEEDIALTMIYTGLRVSEAYGIRAENVDLDRRLFVGVGMKTEAGKNRTVPIADAIFPTIEKYARQCAENASLFLFTHSLDKTPEYIIQSHFKRYFPEHTTHDCRHTFATYAHKNKMNATMVKLIMGHKVTDLTQGTYTHITDDDLAAEMKKYRIE